MSQPTFQEVIPPPIIYESRGPRKNDIREAQNKEKNIKAENCPHCGLSLEA